MPENLKRNEFLDLVIMVAIIVVVGGIGGFVLSLIGPYANSIGFVATMMLLGTYTIGYYFGRQSKK